MMLIAALLIAAALLLLHKIYARLWSRELEVQLSVEEPYIYAGESAHFSEIVANRGRIPLPEIEVRFRIPQGPVFEDAENVILSDHLYKRDVFALRPLEQITRRYILTCQRRGRYPVSDLTVRAMSFWHGKAYEVSQNTAACLTVYASWTDVSGILAHCDAILGSLESRRRTFEDPFAWASIRGYTPQDPMRSVNWKASARTGELMVNTYASVQAAQFCIFLDVTDDRIMREEDLLELGISAAASLSRRLVGRGQEAGLYVYTDAEVELPGDGGVRIAPSRGQSQLTRIEQVLAADLTGYLRRKAGQVPGAAERRHPQELPGFIEWAYEIARVEAADRICVFISKEEEQLQGLEEKWMKDGRGQSVPAIFVEPVNEDGVNKLKSRIIA